MKDKKKCKRFDFHRLTGMGFYSLSGADNFKLLKTDGVFLNNTPKVDPMV